MKKYSIMNLEENDNPVELPVVYYQIKKIVQILKKYNQDKEYIQIFTDKMKEIELEYL